MTKTQTIILALLGSLILFEAIYCGWFFVEYGLGMGAFQ